MVPERIEREILIDAPLEVVWTVVTAPQHVGAWFSDSAEIDLREEQGSARAWVEKVQPLHAFSFRRTGSEPRERNSTLVEFGPGAEGGGTHVELDELRASVSKQLRIPARR